MPVTIENVFCQMSECDSTALKTRTKVTGKIAGHEVFLEFDKTRSPKVVKMSILPLEMTPCERSVFFSWRTGMSQESLNRMVRRFFFSQ